MDNTKTLISQILKKGHLMSLGCMDESGPWVCDVIYTFDESYNLYWVSREESRHSQAFIKNSQAAAAITAVEKPEGAGEAIQLEGAVVTVPGIPADALSRYAEKRGNKTTWTLNTGEAWYKFAPKNIDVIHEPSFGFTKKKLTLD